MSSLYAKYLKEREGYECLETDYYFVAYKKVNDALYIRDMYIDPQTRRKGVGTALGIQLELIAKDLGCLALTTSVDVGTNGWEASKNGIEKFGFKELCKEETCIYYNKEL